MGAINASSPEKQRSRQCGVRQNHLDGFATTQELPACRKFSAFHFRRFQRRMPLANWPDNFVKDFVQYVANTSFQCFVFLWGGPLFNSLDRLIHLAVDVEEYLKDVLCCLRVLKQGCSPWNEF